MLLGITCWTAMQPTQSPPALPNTLQKFSKAIEPEPQATAWPCVLKAMRVFVTSGGVVAEPTYMPPPVGPELKAKVQLVRLTTSEPNVEKPPPSVPAELPENKQLMSVAAMPMLLIPPPWAGVWLSWKVQRLRATTPKLDNPPPSSPAVLPEKVQPVKVGNAELPTTTPPPCPSHSLSEIMQLASVGEESSMRTAPPS